MKVKPEAKEEVREIVRRYGLDLIKRGFITRDYSMCTELMRVGVVVHPTVDDRETLVWAGYEAVVGLHEANGKMYPSRKYFE